MAKPTPLPPLSPTQRVAEVAPAVVALRLGDVQRHEALVGQTADVDGIHDMRVAARRLRAALGFFELPKKVGRAVKRLQDALGDVRDIQVQSAALSDAARHSAPNMRAALRYAGKALLSELGPRRQRLQRELFRWREATVPLVEEKVCQARSRRRLGGHHYQRELPRRRKALVRHIDAFQSDDSAHVAHCLRIATKKLRYDAELLLAFQPEARRVLDQLVPLQEALGDLHDLDVRLALVAERLESGSAHAPALRRVVSQLTRRRAALVLRARKATKGLSSEATVSGE